MPFTSVNVTHEAEHLSVHTVGCLGNAPPLCSRRWPSLLAILHALFEAMHESGGGCADGGIQHYVLCQSVLNRYFGLTADSPIDNTKQSTDTHSQLPTRCVRVRSDQPTAGGVLGASDGGGAAQQPLPCAAVRADHGEGGGGRDELGADLLPLHAGSTAVLLHRSLNSVACRRRRPEIQSPSVPASLRILASAIFSYMIRSLVRRYLA